jgi:xanthine dehydrogenase accessory factor
MSPAEAPEAFAADRSGFLDEAETRFLTVMNPPLRLVIVGAAHIAQALAPMARLAGYDVTVLDPRGAFATEARFPGLESGRTLRADWPEEVMPDLAPDARTAVVCLTHDPKIDDPALMAALPSEAFYVGALGSKRTHAKRVERLVGGGEGGSGLAPAAMDRLHAPIGLDIGAKSPAEIAIAILAQMTERLRRPETRPEARGARTAGAAA